MLIDSPLWNSIMVLLGEVTLVMVLFLVLSALVLLAIALFSVRRGHLYLPRLMKPGFFLLEGLVKAICRFFGLDDRDLISFSIKLQNSLNKKTFQEVPVARRAVFLPQCLRSARCPASLTPEGIWCQGCGLCTTGEAITELCRMGYRVFIVPGSSFIKRMVKKYRPGGIIGVGCTLEVKEGLDLCDQIGIPGMGVVTAKDGCVETLVNWNEVFEVASLGTGAPSHPDDHHPSPE